MSIFDWLRKKRVVSLSIDELKQLIENELEELEKAIRKSHYIKLEELEANRRKLMTMLKNFKKAEPEEQMRQSIIRKLLIARDKFASGMLHIWDTSILDRKDQREVIDEITRLLERTVKLESKHSKYLSLGFKNSFADIRKAVYEMTRLVDEIRSFSSSPELMARKEIFNIIQVIRNIRGNIQDLKNQIIEKETSIMNMKRTLSKLEIEEEEHKKNETYRHLNGKVSTLKTKKNTVDTEISRVLLSLKRPLKKMEHLTGETCNFSGLPDEVDLIEKTAMRLKDCINKGIIELKDRNLERSIKSLEYILDGTLRRMLQEKEKLENELEEANRLLNAEREKILVKRREISNIKEQIAIKEKEILDLRKRLTDMEKRFEETIKLLKNKVAECFRGTIELLE